MEAQARSKILTIMVEYSQFVFWKRKRVPKDSLKVTMQIVMRLVAVKIRSSSFGSASAFQKTRADTFDSMNVKYIGRKIVQQG